MFVLLRGNGKYEKSLVSLYLQLYSTKLNELNLIDGGLKTYKIYLTNYKLIL